MSKQELPIAEKYMLSVSEASDYFNIGIKKMRRLAETHTDSFAIWNGNRLLIIRSRFEAYILNCLTEEGGGKLI